jgi:hypothetical protein
MSKPARSPIDPRLIRAPRSLSPDCSACTSNRPRVGRSRSATPDRGMCSASSARRADLRRCTRRRSPTRRVSSWTWTRSDRSRSAIPTSPGAWSKSSRAQFSLWNQLADTAFASVPQRVARHLLELAATRQESGGVLVARVSQQELADLVGSVREVVSRALRDLREDHIVAVARSGITVLDASRLAEKAWSS